MSAQFVAHSLPSTMLARQQLFRPAGRTSGRARIILTVESGPGLRAVGGGRRAAGRRGGGASGGGPGAIGGWAGTAALFSPSSVGHPPSPVASRQSPIAHRPSPETSPQNQCIEPGVTASLAFARRAPPAGRSRPLRFLVLYICIPAYNEAETIGVLLWRIRKVFQEYSREYEILVYDDGSSDATVETLQPYGEVLPLTVLSGNQHRGYAAALDQLCRAVSARTRYPRRDAMITMQADFTDQPEHLPELIKRFEGGADLVVAERTISPSTPAPVRRLRWLGSMATRVIGAVPGVTDPFASMRLYRISLIRDLLKESGDRPVAEGEGWAANLSLLRRASAQARRMETVPLDPRYDVRARETRVRPWSDGISLLRAPRTRPRPSSPNPVAPRNGQS